MTDLDAIIDGMSEAQRDAMIGEADADMLASVAMSLSLELRLIRPCVKDKAKPIGLDNFTMGFSKLGQAVRSRIIERKEHG